MGKDNTGALALIAIAMLIGVIMLIGGALALMGITIDLFIPSNLWVGLAVVLLSGAGISKLA